MCAKVFSANKMYYLLVFILLVQIILLISGENFAINKCIGASLKPNNGQLTVHDHLMANNEATTFSLVEKTPACSLDVASVSSHDIKFERFGEVSIENEYYSTEEYCISSTENEEIEIKFCKVECGKSHICIPKCCPVNEVIDLLELNCSDPGLGRRKWLPNVYSSTEYKNCGKKEEGWKLHFRREHLPCGDIGLLVRKTIVTREDDLHEGTILRLLTNGSIAVNSPGIWKFLEDGKHCIDRFQNYGNLSHFSGDPDHYAVLYCSADAEIPVDLPSAFAYLMIFTSAFSLATVIIYLLLWDKHNIHGWTIFCFSLSMLFMFIFLATALLSSEMYDLSDSGSIRCVFIGVMAHFFFLSTFSWMSMINVDLFITFKRLSPTTTKSKGVQRFICYSLFGWGIPVTLVGISFILDQSLIAGSSYVIPSNDTECESELIENKYNHVLPEYGIDTCYLSEKSRGYYLYLPIGVLLTCNFLLFSSTIHTLWKYKQSTKQAVKGSSNNQKQSLIIFLKLFFVMGISWISEVISWLHDNHKAMWLIFDLLNILSPVAIFYIFVCKREILVMLYQKYPCLRGMLKSVCKTGLMDTEATEMTGADKSRAHYRNSVTSN